METYIEQDYTLYTPEDHNTWATLSARQAVLRNGAVSQEYLKGYAKLNIDEKCVARIEDISRHLRKLTGWVLVPVTGLLPTKAFFGMLSDKQYPITIYVRKPWELDFSEQPDIFHDVYGHVPLLANELFVSFLQAYSRIAIRYADLPKAVELLGRLYWFTYETGLIIGEDGLRPYGGAVITSAGEWENVRNATVPKLPFDLDRIFETPYNSFRLQNEYFVIGSFDELFHCVDQLEQKLVEHLLVPEEGKLLRNYSLNMPFATA